MVGSGLASATVTPSNLATRAITPSTLDSIGRSLCRSANHCMSSTCSVAA